METKLTRILADIPLFKRFNELCLKHKDFEVISMGTFGANSWRLGEYTFERVSQPMGRFWYPDYWIIKRNGTQVMQTRHYKYCIGLCYKIVGLI